MLLKIEKGFPNIYFNKLIMVSFALSNIRKMGCFILTIGPLHSLNNNKEIGYFKEIP